MSGHCVSFLNTQPVFSGERGEGDRARLPREARSETCFVVYIGGIEEEGGRGTHPWTSGHFVLLTLCTAAANDRVDRDDGMESFIRKGRNEEIQGKKYLYGKKRERKMERVAGPEIFLPRKMSSPSFTPDTSSPTPFPLHSRHNPFRTRREGGRRFLSSSSPLRAVGAYARPRRYQHSAARRDALTTHKRTSRGEVVYLFFFFSSRRVGTSRKENN